MEKILILNFFPPSFKPTLCKDEEEKKACVKKRHRIIFVESAWGYEFLYMIIALLVGHDDKIGSEMIFQQGTTFDIMHCRDSLDLERHVSKISKYIGRYIN